MYRFRSTDDLLERHNELENQEIYFAASDELNDPMEGLKDIYWRGDAIVWQNLIKHYLLCLEHVCSLFVLIGEDQPISRKDINVFITESNLPTPEYQKIISEINKKCFAYIDQFIKNIAKKSEPVRREELLFHISILHPLVLEAIFETYENNNLISKRSVSDEYRRIITKTAQNVGTYNAMNGANEALPNIGRSMDALFAASINTLSQLVLITRYNASNSSFVGKNKSFIFSEYPEAFIQEIEKLLYPDWYAACFIADCKNSSIWGHYGEKHRGVCLKFKSKSKNDNAFIELLGMNGLSNSGPMYGKRMHQFHKIDYEKKFVEVDFFGSLGSLPRPVLMKYWYSNENGDRSACADDIFKSEEQWRNKHWANFLHAITNKLKDWETETEYRLILSSTLLDLQSRDSRKLKYAFNDLDGIIFGIKTSMEDKLKIIKIIESKCRKENRKDFKFYQAYYSKQKGIIDHSEMTLLKFN